MDIILLFGRQTEARLLLPGRGKNTPSKGHVSRPGHKVRALRILFGLRRVRRLKRILSWGACVYAWWISNSDRFFLPFCWVFLLLLLILLSQRSRWWWDSCCFPDGTGLVKGGRINILSLEVRGTEVCKCVPNVISCVCVGVFNGQSELTRSRLVSQIEFDEGAC